MKTCNFLAFGGIALVGIALIFSAASPTVAQERGEQSLESRVAELESRVAAIEGFSPLASADEPLVEASVAEAGENESIDREMIAEQILDAANDSDLRWLEKRRVRRVMTAKRGRLKRAREQAIDYAASEMLTEGVIIATPSGIQPAIDFDAILAFIERLLPLILKIISLFSLSWLEPFFLSFLW